MILLLNRFSDLRQRESNYEPILLESLPISGTGRLDEASALIIVKMLLVDLEQPLMLPADMGVLRRAAEEEQTMTRSWNGGLVGPERVMQRFQDIIAYSALPMPASNEDLLYSPRTLAESLHTVRVRIWTRKSREESVPEITLQDMMEVLFKSDASLTESYTSYINERLAPLVGTDIEAYETERVVYCTSHRRTSTSSNGLLSLICLAEALISTVILRLVL